jgi:hypothetical protein
MERPAPCRVITRTPAREIGNPSSARASIRETRIVRPGLFVFAPHKKSAAADAERRPTHGTTRPRNRLPLSEFDCLQGRLDGALRHSRLYFLRPSCPWRAFFCPQQGSNWNRLPLFEFESATGHADFSASMLSGGPPVLERGPPQQPIVVRLRSESFQSDGIIVRTSHQLTFATWGNSGIVPYEVVIRCFGV